VNSTITITGESGTGKSFLAKEIHKKSSRSRLPFININLATLNTNLIESELFGHEKGAFSSADQRKIGRLEQANQGTVFLDEIAELTPSAQCRLLEFLQSKKIVRVGGNCEIPINVRIIVATNKNLEKLIEEGKFREDLYFRITTFPINLNPLRDRKNEILRFIEIFRQLINQDIGTDIKRLSDECISKILNHQWPGNLRELRNSLEFSFALKKEGLLEANDLKIKSLILHQHGNDQEMFSDRDMDFRSNKEKFEKSFIESALKHFKGKINETSRKTRISKVTLIEKIRKYEIDYASYKSAS
jgi:transcriptional regulator with PAS, ATPase and Fis domain